MAIWPGLERAEPGSRSVPAERGPRRECIADTVAVRQRQSGRSMFAGATMASHIFTSRDVGFVARSALRPRTDHWLGFGADPEKRLCLGTRTPNDLMAQWRIEDKIRTILTATAKPPAELALKRSDGTRATFNLANHLRGKSFRALRDASEFTTVRVGEWRHSLEWPSGVELGAEFLWLETLSAKGRDDTRAFLEWRLRHGVSLTKTADAPGLSRRMVAYYSNGENRCRNQFYLPARAGKSAMPRRRPPNTLWSDRHERSIWSLWQFHSDRVA